MRQAWRCGKCKNTGIIQLAEEESAVLVTVSDIITLIIINPQGAYDEYMHDCGSPVFNVHIADTYWIKKAAQEEPKEGE